MTTLATNSNIAEHFIQSVDAEALEQKVKKMYKDVAERPKEEFHFEMGREMAERLGYPSDVLDHVPPEAIDSFAGVGYYFHYTNLQAGESVVDLGSGSGMDAFFAAHIVGENGRVVGIDMTDEQLAKANNLRDSSEINNVSYLKGYIQSTPCKEESFDAVISNGVVNLAPDKEEVFKEVARLLKPGGRLSLADIVTETKLPEGITCDATLWAACIGGAMQQDDYLNAIRSAGLIIEQVEDNPEYHFLSDNAQGATQTYGVKSISVLARKPDSRYSAV